MAYKLDTATVAAARRRVLAGESVKAVAADMNLAYTTTAAAVRGATHPGDVDGVPPVSSYGFTARHRYLPHERTRFVEQAKALRAAHPYMSAAAIARQLDLEPCTLRRWLIRDGQAMPW
ncbi:hypothetical protein [Corynebacterium glyciniphilum]|uniref:hypothetical protein n=1 Tax=Corynebacterium glyciniphilum TaxID=1404244 RepID=UPI003FD26F07